MSGAPPSPNPQLVVLRRPSLQVARALNLPLAVLLSAMAGLALAASALEWTATGQVPLPFAGLSVTLLAMLAILPWTVGRPVADPTLAACHKCGAEHAGGERIAFCLMCGSFPRPPRLVG